MTAPADEPRPTAATISDEELAQLYADLDRLRAGEEDGWDESIVPTPGQWIAHWNQASAARRLDAAKRIIGNQERAARCFEMNHEARLAEQVQAEAAASGAWLTAGTRDLSIPEQNQVTVQSVDPDRLRADRLATALAEALARLHELTRFDGSVIGWQTVNPIRPALYDRWQAALQPAAPEPGHDSGPLEKASE